MKPIALLAAAVLAAPTQAETVVVGAIAVGRYGDIVAVEGDPLRDVGVLTRVSAVIKGGVLVGPGEVTGP